MAAIAFNTASPAFRTDLLRKWPETVFSFLREMLDAFVAYRLRLAAAEAEHARSQQSISLPADLR